ncbi:reverse transcriptase [Tanacetum coccineum]
MMQESSVFRIPSVLWRQYLLPVSQTSSGNIYKINNTSPNEYRFLRLLRQFLSGDFKDLHEYECHKIFGHWSGVIYFVEKVLDNLSEVLIAVTKGKVHNELLDLYGNETRRPAGTCVDEVCLAKAKDIVEAKNVFHVECVEVLKAYSIFDRNVCVIDQRRGKDERKEIKALREDGLLENKPLAILERKLGKVNNKPVMFMLIQWNNKPVEEATWEIYGDLITRFPGFDAVNEAIH